MLDKIVVKVAYALPEKQYLRQVILRQGSTVEQAIIASNLLELRSDINLNKNKVGVYGRLVKLTYILKDGDRVEIYRSLLSDPRKFLRQKTRKFVSRNKITLE